MDFNRPRRDILFLRILSLLSLQLYIRYTEKIDRFDYDICFNVAFQKITKKEKSENNRGGYHAREIVVPYLRIAILHHSTISSSFYRSLSLSLYLSSAKRSNYVSMGLSSRNCFFSSIQFIFAENGGLVVRETSFREA